jgi:regulator of sirC expression with transglutaminase-like and TPR domain
MQHPHQMYHRWPSAPEVASYGVPLVLDANIQTLWAILELPEPQIDLAKAKLTIDRMIAPAIDIDATLKLLDAMAAEVTAWWRLADASSLHKLNALRTYLYQPGLWNGHRPFGYDYDDPLGGDIRKKLLPNYLATRKGNCVSMPVLFVILGQKLGIDVTVAVAPQHFLVKYRDHTGHVINLEPCDNANPAPDAAYQMQVPMTPESLANGVYMQPLGKRETVAVMMSALMEFYGQQGQQERRIALAGLALDYFPKDVWAMVHIASAYGHLKQQHFHDKYPGFEDIPLEMRPYLVYLGRNNRYWFAKAESLGWREPDEASEAAYRERMKRKTTVPAEEPA